MSKPHYFDAPEEAKDDEMLNLVKKQGYVPDGCLLQGVLVMMIVREGGDPCVGCHSDRTKCGGRQ